MMICAVYILTHFFANCQQPMQTPTFLTTWTQELLLVWTSMLDLRRSGVLTARCKCLPITGWNIRNASTNVSLIWLTFSMGQLQEMPNLMTQTSVSLLAFRITCSSFTLLIARISSSFLFLEYLSECKPGETQNEQIRYRWVHYSRWWCVFATRWTSFVGMREAPSSRHPVLSTASWKWNRGPAWGSCRECNEFDSCKCDNAGCHDM